VHLDAVAVLGVEVADALAQPRLEHVHVADAVLGGAHRVDLELHLPQPEGGEELGRQGHDLHVRVGVGGAQQLQAHLVVLAEAAGLGVLVAERRGGVPDLPGGERVVLDEGPHDRRGALGAQRDVVVALVAEVVHLLAHRVRALGLALEHADVLEHRGLHEAVAGPLDHGRVGGEERFPAGRGGRKDVLGALQGLEAGSSHGPGKVTGPPSAPRTGSGVRYGPDP